MQTNVHTPQDMFFSPIRYEIPPFQRPYIWTQEKTVGTPVGRPE